jgi:hypothetical protein
MVMGVRPQDDPMRNFKFRVRIDYAAPGAPVIPGIADMGFTNVAGINMTTEVINYREGGWNTNYHKLPANTDFGPLTLIQGVVRTKPGMWNLAKNMGRREPRHWDPVPLHHDGARARPSGHQGTGVRIGWVRRGCTSRLQVLQLLGRLGRLQRPRRGREQRPHLADDDASRRFRRVLQPGRCRRLARRSCVISMARPTTRRGSRSRAEWGRPLSGTRHDEGRRPSHR